MNKQGAFLLTADAEGCGNLAPGSGHLRLGSGAFEGSYDFRSHMGDGKGTAPDESLGGVPCRGLLDGARAPADQCSSLSNTSIQ